MYRMIVVFLMASLWGCVSGYIEPVEAPTITGKIQLDKNSYYSGEMKNEKAHGHGQLIENGRVLLDGSWAYGQFVEGIMYWKNGKKYYEGSVNVLLLPDGTGTMWNENGKVVHSGYWEHGVPVEPAKSEFRVDREHESWN